MKRQIAEAKGRQSSMASIALGWLFSFCLLPSAFCLSPSPSPAPAVNHGPQTYDSFRLVHTRNVFDPDRRPVRPTGNAPAYVPGARADYVALTGIAVNGDKSLAFFSGSRSEYNMVIPAGSKVAGATLAKINPMNIEVDRNGRHLVINVGQTVPLDDKSAPADAPVAEAVSTPAAIAAVAGTVPAATSPATGAASAAPVSAANLDEIRRRMMERHNQEQK